MDIKNINYGSVAASLLMMMVDFCKDNNFYIPDECIPYFNQEFTELNDIYERVSIRVWCNILFEIYQQHPVDNLGLKISKYMQPAYAGILTYLAFSNRSLFDAVQDFVKYSRLVYDYQYMNIEIKGDQIKFSWSNYNKLLGLLVDELFIAVFINILRIALPSQRNLVKRVDFIYGKPLNFHAYKSFFQCPVYFNMQLSAVIFSVSELKNVRLLCPDEILYKMLKQQIDQLIHRLESYDYFKNTVYLSMMAAIKNKNVSIEKVASYMGVSVTEFRKNLNRNNCDFHELLSETRWKLAQKYLKDSKISINEIASLLGYTEQSSFQRAFKNRTGITPLKWRKENIEN